MKHKSLLAGLMTCALAFAPGVASATAASNAGATSSDVSFATPQDGLPFAWSGEVGQDGKLHAVFTAPTATDQQLFDVSVSAEGSKKPLYTGKLQGRKDALRIKGLEAGQTYLYHIRSTDGHGNKSNVTLTYTGELVLQTKQDAAGQTTDVHLQLGDVQTNTILDPTQTQSLTIFTHTEAESNDTSGTANSLTLGDDTYGKINQVGDIDWYKVQSYQDGTAHLWLGAIPAGNDYDLYVYDQNLTRLDYSIRGSNYDEMISALPVTANQTYYVKVIGYNNSYDANQSYDLRVTASTSTSTTADEYEHNDAFADATSISNNTSIYANLNATTDADYYRIYVPLRSNFHLDLTNIPTDTDYDVRLYDQEETTLDYSLHASNTDEAIDYTLDPGYYLVKVYSYNGSSDSDYRLQLSTKTIPVILFPGIGGTQLMANDDLTWFSLWDALLINAPLKHNLALAPACSGCADVVAKNSDVTITPNTNDYGLEGISYLSSYHLSMAAYYQSFIADLKKAGYVPGRTLFGFPYDWRLDNHSHNARLTSTINQALSASGADQVQAVAHSMGGLVLKDYLLNNTAMQSKFDQVITVGTPFLGAAMASKAVALGGYNFGIPILMDSTGEVISENAPAVYQLTPSQEYDNRLQAQLGRTSYRYIDIWGNQTDYTHDQLTAKYPNQALVDQADARHAQWDSAYPGVRQYHIVGDTKNTVTAYNYWVMKDLFTWHYLEYVMTKGDGTVPLLSATDTGNASSTFYYSSADHTGLVKDSATRKQLLDFLKGESGKVENGIRTAADASIMPELTADSLTSSDVSFNGMRIDLDNKKTGVHQVIQFRDDGSLDEENSSAELMPKFARLDDGTYNLQWFTNKYDDYDMTVQTADGNEYIVAKYDLTASGPTNRYTFGKVQPTATQPLTFKQVNGVTSVYEGSNALNGQQLTLN
ncbi:MAG TPA: hypothetical protein VFV52_12370 [Bacilli bacterium]|nr:hypothetical protein [Bacilli bacterium]